MAPGRTCRATRPRRRRTFQPPAARRRQPISRRASRFRSQAWGRLHAESEHVIPVGWTPAVWRLDGSEAWVPKPSPPRAAVEAQRQVRAATGERRLRSRDRRRLRAFPGVSRRAEALPLDRPWLPTRTTAEVRYAFRADRGLLASSNARPISQSPVVARRRRRALPAQFRSASLDAAARALTTDRAQERR